MSNTPTHYSTDTGGIKVFAIVECPQCRLPLLKDVNFWYGKEANLVPKAQAQGLKAYDHSIEELCEGDCAI